MSSGDKTLAFMLFMLVIGFEHEFWPSAVAPTLVVAATASLFAMILILVAIIKFKPK